MPDLLFFLLFGHFVGDFALQSDKMAATKGESRRVLTWHVSIYTLCIAGSLWIGLFLKGSEIFLTLTTLIVIVALWGIHWLQDFIKMTRYNGDKQAFFVDQALHLLQLYLIRIFIYHV
jgi:uncharacterized membrane protein YphA (DoxX/SURF4 family)